MSGTVAMAAEDTDTSFRDTLASLAAPTLAADGVRVDDFRVRFGNTEFTLNGEVEGVIAAGRAAGFAFRGAGTGEVNLVDGPFRQANLVTLKDKGEVANVDEDSYRFDFSDAVFFTNATPEDLVAGKRTTDSSLGEILARSVERWNETRLPGLDHALAPMVLDPDRPPQVMALLWLGQRDSVYFCDTADGGDEEYGVLRKVPPETGQSFHYVDTYILQPAVLDLEARPVHELAQTAVDLEIVSTDNVNATETTTTTLVAGRNGVWLAVFDLLNGRDELPVDWDARSHPITVAVVRSAAGEELAFSHRYDELMVELPSPLDTGEEITITVEASGGFLKNFSRDAYLVLGNMSYFPQLDIYSSRTSFHAVVKVADPFIPIACGRTVRRWAEDGLNCLESREEYPLAFPFIVVGKFSVEERSDAGYDVRVYSYGGSKKRGAKKLIQNAFSILDFYSNGLIPFPYRELEVIEIPYYRHFFWQAPAGLVEITSEGLNPLGGDDSDLNTIIKRYASKGQNSRFAHEIAHQWFGNLIGWATPYDNWISESFAEYLSYLFMSDGAKDQRKARDQFEEWKIDVEECSDVSSIYGAAALNGKRDHRQCYTQLLYGKGPYVLHALRQDMGDPAFFRMLHLMTKAASQQPHLKMVTNDVILFASAITRRDYRPWFDRYVYGTEVPALE